MNKTITYSDKFTSANTVYAEINLSDKTLMLDKIAQAFYKLLEDANYKDTALQILASRDKDFRKHLSSGDRKLNNSLQSFLAGLLLQHHNKINKDISTKMLPGIELASQVLHYYDYLDTEYKFEKETNRRQVTTPFDKLFS